MSIASLIPAAEAAHESGGINPWIVGIGTFVLLLVFLVALVGFGGGRDHS